MAVCTALQLEAMVAEVEWHLGEHPLLINLQVQRAPAGDPVTALIPATAAWSHEADDYAGP